MGSQRVGHDWVTELKSELSRAVIPHSFWQYQIRQWRSVQVSVSSLECTLKVTYFKTSLRFCNSNFFFWEEFNHIVYKNFGKFQSHHSIFRTCFKDVSFVEIFLLDIYPPLIKEEEIIGFEAGIQDFTSGLVIRSGVHTAVEVLHNYVCNL